MVYLHLQLTSPDSAGNTARALAISPREWSTGAMTRRNGTLSEKERAYLRRYYATHKDERREYQRKRRAINGETLSAKNRAKWHMRKEQYAEKRRLYRAVHKEELRAKNRAYRAEHAEEIKEQRRLYRLAHAEELRVKNAKWRAENREAQKVYIKDWRTTHQEKVRAYGPAYRAAHPEVVRELRIRRQARIKGAKINDLTAAQWQEIQAAYNYRCVYCPQTCWWCQHKKHALTRDHIIPLVRGGDHTFSNIVPACKKHNSQKQAGPILNPVQPLLLTLAPSSKRKKRG